MYSEGEWKVGRVPPLSNWVIGVNLGELMTQNVVANLYDNKDDADLIAATVNACIKLNPDNPIAVAESISDLYEALGGLISGIHTVFFEQFDKDGTLPFIEGYKEAVLARAKVEEK